MRYLDEQAIENIAIGAAFLGTGGGGDPYIGKMMALTAIKNMDQLNFYPQKKLRMMIISFQPR